MRSATVLSPFNIWVYGCTFKLKVLFLKIKFDTFALEIWISELKEKIVWNTDPRTIWMNLKNNVLPYFGLIEKKHYDSDL